MLLDDTQVAINELLAACQESAEHYSDAAGRVGEGALGELLDRIGTERRADVERLADTVRASGLLPRAPYADRQELHRLVTHAKAALADDETRVLLDDRIEDEERVEGLAAEVLRLEPSAEARACVERIEAHAAAAKARLAAAVADR